MCTGVQRVVPLLSVSVHLRPCPPCVQEPLALLQGWVHDFEALQLRHSPATLTSLVKVHRRSHNPAHHPASCDIAHGNPTAAAVSGAARSWSKATARAGARLQPAPQPQNTSAHAMPPCLP